MPILITLVFILSRCCCWTRLKNFFRNLLDKIFFNSIIKFVGSTALTIAFSCSINIYQVYRGVANKNGSYYFAFFAVSTLVLCILTLIAYFHYKFGQLCTEQQINRVGAAYTNLAVEKKGRLILGFLFFSFGRSIAVAFLITYGI